jgi:hypothetical protein
MLTLRRPTGWREPLPWSTPMTCRVPSATC